MKYEKFQCSVPRLPREGEGPGKRGAFDGSMQHYLGSDLFKADVYDPA